MKDPRSLAVTQPNRGWLIESAPTWKAPRTRLVLELTSGHSCAGQGGDIQIPNVQIRNRRGGLPKAGKNLEGDVMSSGKSSGNAWAAEQTAKRMAKIWATWASPQSS